MHSRLFAKNHGECVVWLSLDTEEQAQVAVNKTRACQAVKNFMHARHACMHARTFMMHARSARMHVQHACTFITTYAHSPCASHVTATESSPACPCAPTHLVGVGLDELPDVHGKRQTPERQRRPFVRSEDSSAPGLEVGEA